MWKKLYEKCCEYCSKHSEEIIVFAFDNKTIAKKNNIQEIINEKSKKNNSIEENKSLNFDEIFTKKEYLNL